MRHAASVADHPPIRPGRSALRSPTSVDAMSGLLRSNVVVASGTLVSRVTGLIRVMVFAYVVGQTALADAYKLSNETPNIIYDLIIGGVLSATLVPVITSVIAQAGTAVRRQLDAIVTTAVLAISALTLVAVLAAPLIFRLYSITLSADVDPSVFRSAGTTLTRIFLVQILFYGLTGVMNAILHSRERFAAAAWAPVVANVVVITTLLTIPGAGSRTRSISEIGVDGRLTWTLGLGATGGIAIMSLIVIAAVVRSGYVPRFAWSPGDPAVRRLLSMSGWTLAFVLANQVALVVVRNLAEPGSALASAYFDAFTFFVLPHGLLAVSVATTFQPRLARDVASGDGQGFAARMSTGITAIVALTAPASAALIVLATPIVQVFMERGQFDPIATANTSSALRGLAIGLVGFSVFLFTLRGFYANHDTRTPFMLNLFENALNIVLAIVLVGPFGVAGLGAALGFAYLIAAVAAVVVVRQRWAPSIDVRAIAVSIIKWLTAAAGAGAIMAVGRELFDAGGSSTIATTVWLAGALVAGLVTYWMAALLVRADGVPTVATARAALSRAAARGRHDG